MTAIASDDLPEEWSQWDDIAVEVYSHIDHITRLGDFNALVFFADELFLDHEVNKIELDEDDATILRDFLDLAMKADTTIQKYLGPSYINDYIETIETEDTDEQP
jgi:hypothetical protein